MLFRIAGVWLMNENNEHNEIINIIIVGTIHELSDCNGVGNSWIAPTTACW